MWFRRLSLSFEDPDLERAWRAHSLPTKLSRFRGGALVAASGIGLMGIRDLVLQTDGAGPMMALRLGVGVPVWLLAAWASTTWIAARFDRFALAVSCAAIGLFAVPAAHIVPAEIFAIIGLLRVALRPMPPRDRVEGADDQPRRDGLLVPVAGAPARSAWRSAVVQATCERLSIEDCEGALGCGKTR